MADSHGHGHQDAHAAPAANAAPLPAPRLVANYSAGGHEIDATPNRNLMGFLGVMVVLMVLAAAGVYQLFVAHTGDQLTDAANVASPQLVEEAKRDKRFATTWGKVEVEGKVVAYRMPFADAKRLVLSQPERFKAAPPPNAEWVHPDDAAKPK